MKKLSLVILLLSLFLSASLGQLDKSPKTVPEEISALRSQKAAADSQIAVQEKQISDYKAAVSDARAAVNTANGMLWSALGAVAIVLGFGAFQYIRASIEDRTKITEHVREIVLQAVEESAGEKIKDIISPLNAQILEAEGNLKLLSENLEKQEENLKPHFQRFYRALARIYVDNSRENYSSARYAWSLTCGLHAIDAAMRCGNDTLVLQYKALFSDLIKHGGKLLGDHISDIGPNEEELAVLQNLWSNEQDANTRSVYQMLITMVQEFDDQSNPLTLPEPLMVPE